MVRMSVQGLATLVVAAVVLGAASGCDDGMPSVATSNEEVTVKGIVRVKGQPLDDGEITFDPTNIKRKDAGLRTAKVKAGGYEIKSLVGGNSITVRSKQIDKDMGLSSNSKYAEPTSGENQLDVDVP